MNIVYRPMHLSDVEGVWELFEVLKAEKAGVSFTEIIDKRELNRILEDANVFLYIAEDGGKVISVLRGSRGVDASIKHSVLLSAATHPGYRNKGIARELTLAGLEDMKKDGVTLARLYIYSDNYASINTALRLGFTISGAVYRHHFNEQTQEYVDDIILHKLL